MKKIKKILNKIPEKQGMYKNTTTLKWKKDVIEFFINKDLDKCLEIGTCDGITTKNISRNMVN